MATNSKFAPPTWEGQLKRKNMNTTAIAPAKADTRTLFAELEDIIVHLKWVHISRDYFGRSSAWIYQKFQGTDGNGREGGFTPEEQEKMKGALMDMAERIRRAAERI